MEPVAVLDRRYRCRCFPRTAFSQASLVLFACFIRTTYMRCVVPVLALIYCILPARCWTVVEMARERRGDQAGTRQEA